MVEFKNKFVVPRGDSDPTNDVPRSESSAPVRDHVIVGVLGQAGLVDVEDPVWDDLPLQGWH